MKKILSALLTILFAVTLDGVDARAGNAGNGTKVERRVEYAKCFECNRPTSGCQRRHWLDNRERL